MDLFDVPVEPDEFPIALARKEKLHVFWEPENWGLWSSPNMRYLYKPVHRPSIDRDNGLLGDYHRRPRKTRWLDPLEPFLGFWPLRPEWTGPFACLNLIPGRLPIIWVGKTWHLHSDAAVAWQNLEGKLVNLGTGLLRRHITARYEWAEIRPSTLPYEYRYLEYFKSSEDCAAAIYRTRTAFVGLTAFVSFAIALDLAENPPVEGTTPSWQFYAQSQLGMDPVWLSDVANTFVTNFTPGFRPGSYVRATATTYKQSFPAYKIANVPLFINWGSRPPYLRDDDLIWRYRPCQAEAKRAIDLYCSRLAPADDPRASILFWYNMNTPGQSFMPQTPLHTFQPPSPSPPPLLNNDEPQVVMDDSPQSPSPSHQGQEDPPDPHVDGPNILLARLAEERRVVMLNETGDAARHRQRVELQAEADRVDRTLSQPTVGEALVVWVEQGNHAYTSYVVPREKWEDTWCLYLPEERHYTADYEEWNLIRESDVNDSDTVLFPSECSYTRAKAPTEPARLSEIGPVLPDRHSSKTIEEQMERLWKARYFAEDDGADGLSSSDGDDDDDEEYEDTTESSNKRKRMPHKKAIPTDNRIVPHLKNQTIPQLTPQRDSDPIYLIKASRFPRPDGKTVLHNKYRYIIPEPYAPSRQMCEVIHGEDGEHIEGLAKPTLALKRLGIESAHHTEETSACSVDLYNYFHLAKDPKLSPPSWDFAPTLHRQIVNHGYFHYSRISSERHVIGVRGKPLVNQWYLLVLYDARAVTELFYQQLESIGQMVRYLIQQGMPFATGKPVLRPPRTPAATHSEPTLGFRHRSHTFDLVDFSAYETKKIDVLQGSAGRAALMRGGIVWRLAYDTVAPKRVTNGPASNVAWSGKNIGDLNGHTLVDDNLSPAAEDAICGVYKVYTGIYQLFLRRK